MQIANLWAKSGRNVQQMICKPAGSTSLQKKTRHKMSFFPKVNPKHPKTAQTIPRHPKTMFVQRFCGFNRSCRRCHWWTFQSWLLDRRHWMSPTGRTFRISRSGLSGNLKTGLGGAKQSKHRWNLTKLVQTKKHCESMWIDIKQTGQGF